MCHKIALALLALAVTSAAALGQCRCAACGQAAGFDYRSPRFGARFTDRFDGERFRYSATFRERVVAAPRFGNGNGLLRPPQVFVEVNQSAPPWSSPSWSSGRPLEAWPDQRYAPTWSSPQACPNGQCPLR